MFILSIATSNMSYSQTLDTIYISYTDSVDSYFKIAKNKALKQGVLTRDLKKKQQALIKWKDLNFDAKIRLKGDWTDHIQEERHSFRIELTSGNIYKIRKFSLQFPETRGGTNEAVFHEVLKTEGILTTTYKFVHLVVNGSYWGEFAFEEHFDELLIENNQRAYGPILKFDEEGFWECQYSSKLNNDIKCYEYQIFDASRIKAFNQKKILRDSIQMFHFLNARSILEKWQMGKVDFKRIDIEKFAKYYALCDVFQFYHGLQWHNQRFYYRKVDQKIEPVAYDCYSIDNFLIGKSFLGLFDDHYQKVYFKEQWFNYQLFNSVNFRKLYYHWLKEYKSKDWNLKENQLSSEQKKRLAKRVLEIDEFLKEQQLFPEFYSYSQWKKDNPDDVKVYNEPKNKNIFPHVAIRARLERDSIRLTNYDLNLLTVIGFGSKTMFQKTIIPQNINSNQTLFIEGNEGCSHLYYLDKNRDTLISIIELPDLILKKKIQDSIYSKGAIIENKSITITNHIIIPKGQNLIIRDAKVDFKKGGKITAYGNVQLLNSHIYSSDLKGEGIVVIYADLEVKHSKITSFNVRKNNAPLQCTHGKVTLDDIKLENIESNDGINLNNCTFQIRLLKSKAVSGDAVDLDFGRGKIIHSSFKNVGGDAIDLSGALVEINDVKIVNCADKGISIGERSEINASNIQIIDCELGIAVKDESILMGTAIEIKKCINAVNCFIKKDYYNYSGKIELKGNNNWLNAQ